jgi:hypothetical protein
MPGKYDGYDWDELPQDVQEAAKVLGFNAKLWDDDKMPDECDEYWKDLTPEQQSAAAKLGYDQTSWDSS